MSIFAKQNSLLMRISDSAVIAGGFLLLLCEIRFEHRAVLIDDWRSWLPILFCEWMLLVIPIAPLAWSPAGKIILRGSYGISVYLGILGLVFHSEGHFFQRLSELLSVLFGRVCIGATVESHHPPLLAPAAFIGLGVIGFLFTAKNERASVQNDKEVVSS